ncbi:MAG: long-chain fatty acid--CoA ligase [Candidatus Aminicenantes bacterium]|nr:MAG: long-chain fatty acid--CoA ligase [Candidatus Aminicenantes bacterium]
MVETISQLFSNTIRSYQRDDLILYKKEGKYVPMSTEEFGNKVKYFSLGLKEMGLNPEDKLVILSETRPEWVMTDFGNICAGGVTVPVYPSLMPEQIKYIVEDSNAKIVVYSDSEQGEKIAEIRGDLSNVTHYVTFESEAPDGVLTFDQVLEKGKKIYEESPDLFDKAASLARPDTLASILYTSGTTGVPKGVMLTHNNFVTNVKGVTDVIEFSNKDTVLSWLPLSHSFERIATYTYLFKGCSIAYAEDMLSVGQNMPEIRPTIVVGVPRLFEKVYAAVMDNVLASSPMKRKIFFWATKVGRKFGQRTLRGEPIPKFLEFKRKIAHKLVFSKIIAKTGGRIRFFVTGAAPLSKDIAELFYAMGLIVLEGYGLTETSPVISVNRLEKIKFGSVGPTIPEVEVKIAEDGEILARGPNIMRGYYNMEEETKEAIKDGWFYTGDIGHLDEDGFIFITDRKKDIIVTAGGKNVAPQPIENALKSNSYVNDVLVIGDKRKFMSALVVPNFEKLEEYAKFNNIPYKDKQDLIKNEDVIKFLEAEVDRATPNFASYEKVKRVALLDREFTISDGEITPTFKIKRNVVEKKYKDLIDALYIE